MPKDLVPDLYLNTIYELDITVLLEKNIKGIIVDIDNTLVSWDTAEPDEACTSLIQKLLSNGFKVCFLSNAHKKRVELFNLKLTLPAIHNAFKPSRKSFIKAMRLLDTDPTNTAVIGDQLFTDILGGKRLGLFTILVSPISTKEFFWTRLVRRFEKRLLRNL